MIWIILNIIIRGWPPEFTRLPNIAYRTSIGNVYHVVHVFSMLCTSFTWNFNLLSIWQYRM